MTVGCGTRTEPRGWSMNQFWSLMLPLLAIGLTVTDAAFVQFQNCLDNDVINSEPRLLQFVPLNVAAAFNRSSDAHNLNLTIYGNVTGQSTAQPYPPPNDPSWLDPKSTFGKILNVSVSNNKYTTLFTRFNVLSYTPYNANPTQFCDSVIQDECPLGPAFNSSSTDLQHLPAFSVAHDMFSSYSFASITATMRIQSGDSEGQFYGCITATVTPDLGSSLKKMLRYLPLTVLIVVGVATIAASILSPWGSADIFNWSSNFGRDEDILRLVTPGFGDCLQYIQFIVLTGSLSLNYPGFYQPVVSRVAWSSLMFNESFVTNGNGTQSTVDGVYQLRNTTVHGLDSMGQYVGMTSSKDLWVGMIVWLVVIIAAVSILTQLGFALRWLYRQVANVPAEDLRSKNGPFTVGNVVRVSLNFFLLPMLALSFYQFVIASQGPAYSAALSALVIVAVLIFAARLLFLFIRTRPRSFLFDDLLTVLAYGPLYNTYCDDAATFALVPIFVNFLRGIAIGAVQPSGVAQVVLLAICEIILILTINTFRPYPSATSMNIYHTCFSVIRLLTILLTIAFVPSLGVGDSSRGWIGYAILLIHACVLVFGFFLNAVQTLIEVIARLAGAGGRDNAHGGAARGGLTKVFGMRQLSRRMPRRDQAPRQSMNSQAAMLNSMESGQSEVQMAKSRSRSISASSTMLLDNSGRNPTRLSQNLDGLSAGDTTPDQASTFSKPMSNRLSGISTGAIVGLQQHNEAKDPFYRPPRRNTMEPFTSTDKPNKTPFASGDWTRGTAAMGRNDVAVEDDVGEGTSTPARAERDDFEDAGHDLTRTKTDYAVREVDFYYGVRGPALSSGTRKLKTGPADPTGTVSSATGWFKGLLGGKTKEKNKGFEVVRSARAPTPGLIPPWTPDGDQPTPEPYRDDAQSPVSLRHGRMRSPPREGAYDDVSVEGESDEERVARGLVARKAPSLPLIDSVGAIELPSRIGSEASRRPRRRPPPGLAPEVPAVPRRSSRRESGENIFGPGRPKLPSGPASHNSKRDSNTTLGSARIPFATTQAATSRVNRGGRTESLDSNYMLGGDEENVSPDPPFANRLRQSSSALGTHVALDRPSSVGFVQQYRASDNIHRSPDGADFAGSTAEVVHGRSAAER